MKTTELDRLDLDHPDWNELSNADLYARHWMYFADTVRSARAEVHWRRLKTAILEPVEHLLDWLVAHLNSHSARHSNNPPKETPALAASRDTPTRDV